MVISDTPSHFCLHTDLNFSLNELVKDGKNGYIFKNAKDLGDQTEKLLRGFPNAPALNYLRSSFNRTMRLTPHHHDTMDGREWDWCTWPQNCDNVIKPLLLTDLERDRELERVR